jgi:hypothetical protein
MFWIRGVMSSSSLCVEKKEAISDVETETREGRAVSDPAFALIERFSIVPI